VTAGKKDHNAVILFYPNGQLPTMNKWKLNAAQTGSVDSIWTGLPLLLAIALIGGCEVGPNYHPPRQPMPARWVAPTTRASVTVESPILIERWWTAFRDPVLDSLVRRAVQSNLTLRAAQERLVEARASLGIATAGFFPTVDASGSYRRSFSASGGSVVVTGGGGGTGTITGGSSSGTSTKVIGPRPHDLWQAGFDASWELDIFGGVRRSIEAANATVQAAIEDRRDVLVSLLGDVATDYVTLRGYQQEIVIAQDNLSVQIHSSQVARKKVEGGANTELDVANADAQVAGTRSQIASLESLERQEIYAISVLLGREPLALEAELAPRQRIPTIPPEVPVGLPSELLRRRPDIRRAERQLAATTAEIGVATAQLFPQFSLTGSFSLQGSRYEALSNFGTRFWSFGPSFTWPIFDAGRIWSNIQVQNAVQAQALTTYQATVLQALQEVENALTAYSLEQKRRSALEDAVAANQKAVRIAQQRYEQGVTDFLNVLVAQGSLFSSQDAKVQSDRAVATDLVALYKALGGGWEIGEPPVQQAAGH
jgi:outer membrane protein, multidrug efflux system